MTRVSSLNTDYKSGGLSNFPESVDTKDSLYDVRNNAQTILKQSLMFGGKILIVDSTNGFPSTGLLRIGAKSGTAGNAELLYYGKKTSTSFTNLTRGFAGSIRGQWKSGSYVSNAVMAEHHNAVKDALLNIQKKLGLKNFPEEDSVNGIIKKLENIYLAPKPKFRIYPRVGPPPLKVRFQNFSIDAVRYLWDFGDGTTSIEKSPSHTYLTEGIFTVKLNIITSSGAQGVAIKRNYIKVSDFKHKAFFYVSNTDPTNPAYSQETADALVLSGDDPTAIPAVFDFIDQTDGDIVQRFWIFGDGTTRTETDPDIHSTTYSYLEPGEYEPSLIVILANEAKKRVFLQEELTIL